MVDVGVLRQRYETVKVIENSKDNVIEVTIHIRYS